MLFHRQSILLYQKCPCAISELLVTLETSNMFNFIHSLTVHTDK